MLFAIDAKSGNLVAEGLAVYDGAVLIVYESGATHFRTTGGKNPTDRIWQMILGE